MAVTADKLDHVTCRCCLSLRIMSDLTRLAQDQRGLHGITGVIILISYKLQHLTAPEKLVQKSTLYGMETSTPKLSLNQHKKMSKGLSLRRRVISPPFRP